MLYLCVCLSMSRTFLGNFALKIPQCPSHNSSVTNVTLAQPVIFYLSIRAGFNPPGVGVIIEIFFEGTTF